MKHLESILAFATEKHKGQKRKDGKDYITHPIEVARIAEEMARKENKFSEKEVEMIYCIGLLHDTVESVNITERDLKEVLKSTELFTNYEIEKIIEAIFDLTRASKNTPVLNYLESIKGNRFAKIVKLADLEHNLSDLGPGDLRDKYHLCQYYLNT